MVEQAGRAKDLAGVCLSLLKVTSKPDSNAGTWPSLFRYGYDQ